MNFLINITNDNSPWHKHKNYEIVVCTKGNGILEFKGENINMNPGKMVVIPPGVMHCGYKMDTDYERTYLSGEYEHAFHIDSPILITDTPEGEGLTLTKMIYGNRHSHSAYLSSLINTFVHFLLENSKRKNQLFSAVKIIADEIGNSFHDCNIKLNDILRKSGYAEDYIRTQFKSIIGKTPTEFLNETRIKHACYLIDIYKNSISLADIAGKCGYLDYVYFSRKFKQITGMSPRKYCKETMCNIQTDGVN